MEKYQTSIFDHLKTEGEQTSGKRVQGGKPTSNLVLSAHVAGNADIFPQILKLHVPKGSTIADVTYGKGVFWRNVPKSEYKLLATDISMGVDCRNLPYETASIDCLILDPPIWKGSIEKKMSKKQALEHIMRFEMLMPMGMKSIRTK